MTQSEPIALRVRNVAVAFGGVVALDDVSLDIAAGARVAVIGPNGAGKTTLVDVITGDRAPDGGTVQMLGRTMNALTPVARARLGLSRSFQHLSLFDGLTVREHVLLGYLTHAAPRLRWRGFVARRRAVASAAAADRSSLGPEALIRALGLARVADEPVSAQSVGTVRLVDLARALAARPKVLLLDEPVSGLADAEVDVVATLLKRLCEEHRIALLTIEHNLEFARQVSDRLVALDFGRLIADGDPDEVLASEAVRVAYFGNQATSEPAMLNA